LTTPILNIPEVANNQVDQYATVNEALRDLEAAGNDVFDIDMSSADASITNVSPDFVFSRYAVFRAIGNAVPRALTVPAAKRLFVVWNSGSADLSVIRGSASIVVSAGSAFVFYADGTTNGLVALSGGGGGGGSAAWDALVEPASSAGTLVIDLASPAGFAVTLTEDVTALTFDNIPADKFVVFAVAFTQDSTGGWEITWPAAVQGAPSQPNAAAESVTVMSFATWDGGTTIYQAP
jgi:hypothetical protein